MQEVNGIVEEAVRVKEKHWFAISRYAGGEWVGVFCDQPRDRTKVVSSTETFNANEIKLICVEL